MEYYHARKETSHGFPIGDIIKFEKDTENLAAFIASRDPSSRYTVFDEVGEPVLRTMGIFVDIARDKDFLEGELKPLLIPMQMGEMKILKVRCYTDKYRKEFEVDM
ncbi:hypothetical protein BH739_01295 [Enterococcus casseliflavus]|nr:hypothetical protein BH739_01295 [Enterococcus casseliflavus]